MQKSSFATWQIILIVFVCSIVCLFFPFNGKAGELNGADVQPAPMQASSVKPYALAQASLFSTEMDQLNQEKSSCQACQDLAWNLFTKLKIAEPIDLPACKKLAQDWLEQCAPKPKDCSWYPIAEMSLEGLDKLAGTQFIKELKAANVRAGR